MTSIFLMLLLSVSRLPCVFPAPSCPVSCVVCSENAVVCHRLAHIMDAPGTTQALLLTEGSISTVPSASLSHLSNLSVIGLSHNRISVLGERSFRNMPFLHTVLLDHNLLSSQVLQEGALTNLTQLQVLALGHNLIRMIQAVWLKGTKSLRSLKLEGNLLTSLDSGSFPLNDLKHLETLDLSDNLIQSLDRNSFRGLVGLRTLDLSRNRLSSAPSEPFSYLNWLTNLNLEHNVWNCSCQLLQLAAFLSAFVQQPDKTLYNGHRMVCVDAANPSVTTVLELTEANCVPSNQNITVQIETRDSVKPQLYAQNLAITAVICFTGGVSLTLLVVLICYQVSHKKKMTQREKQRAEDEESGPVINHLVNHYNGKDGRKDHFLQSIQPWDDGATTVEAGMDRHDFRPRTENETSFRCLDCRAEGPRMDMTNWDKISGGIESEEDRKWRMRMIPGSHTLSRDIPDRFLCHDNYNSSSVRLRKDFDDHRGTTAAYEANFNEANHHRKDVEVSRGYETLHCGSCHRTYRPTEQNLRQRIHSSQRDSGRYHVAASQHRPDNRGGAPYYNQFDLTRDSRRETKNVTFQLESSKTLKEEGRKGKHRRENRDKERSMERKHRVQSSHAMKVKQRIKPLRKSKVHPSSKKKPEQGNVEDVRSKKSKGKRQEDKEITEEEGKGGSGKNTMEISKKLENSTKSKESNEGDEKEAEEADTGEQERSSNQKTMASGSGQSADDQGQNVNQVKSQNTSSDSLSTADRSHTVGSKGGCIMDQGRHLRGQNSAHEEAGLGAGTDPLPFQHSPTPTAPGRNCTSSHASVGGAGSPLTGSSLSLQTGNAPLSTKAPGGSALSSTVGSNRPTASSLLTNSGLVSPLQTRTAQISPPHGASPPLILTQAAFNSSSIRSHSQHHLLPESSPLDARPQLDPVIGTEHQSGGSMERHAPQNAVLPVQAPLGTHSTMMTAQVPRPVMPFENLSNNFPLENDGFIPGGVTAEGTAGTQDPVTGISEVSQSAADVQEGCAQTASPQSASSSTGSAPAVPALLQQEYLSEEGVSSPRRKLRLVLPEKTSSREPTALERKIR